MIPIEREDIVLMMEGGYLSLRMGRLEQARDIFEGVHVLAPESEVPLVALGSVYFGEFKFEQAVKAYKKALKVKPASAFARAYLGESFFFQGKKEEAIRELEKASLLDPKGKSGDFARALLSAIEKGFVAPSPVPQKTSH